MKAPTPFQIVGKGVKALGKAASFPFRWAGRQVEKEMRMNKRKDDMYRKQGKELNRSYSLPNVRIQK